MKLFCRVINEISCFRNVRFKRSRDFLRVVVIRISICVLMGNGTSRSFLYSDLYNFISLMYCRLVTFVAFLSAFLSVTLWPYLLQSVCFLSLFTRLLTGFFLKGICEVGKLELVASVFLSLSIMPL